MTNNARYLLMAAVIMAIAYFFGDQLGAALKYRPQKAPATASPDTTPTPGRDCWPPPIEPIAAATPCK